MADKHIAIYLNDHVEGSVAALEILEQLETEHTGTPLHIGEPITTLRQTARKATPYHPA